jgi:hypothetical protein
LISHQQVQVHNLLIKQHACDLANKVITVRTLDAGVDHVTDKLLLLLQILNVSQRSHTLRIGQRHLSIHYSRLLGGGLILILGLSSGLLGVLAISARARSLATSSSGGGLLACLVLASLTTSVGFMTAHQLIANLVDCSADELLHVLLLLRLTFSVQIHFGDPKFNIDRLISERSALI